MPFYEIYKILIEKKQLTAAAALHTRPLCLYWGPRFCGFARKGLSPPWSRAQLAPPAGRTMSQCSAELGRRGQREAARAVLAVEAMGEKAEEPMPGATAGNVSSNAGARAAA